MPVQSLSAFDPTKFFHPAADSKKVCGSGGDCRLDTQVRGVAVSNDLSGRLKVTTAEGDQITLTVNLEADFRAIRYQFRRETDGTEVDIDARSIEYSLKKEFNVTVEGDLNADELKDLSKLFRTVSNIFRKYFRGEGEEALAKTARLADRFGHLSSLAGLDLNVDIERSVTVVAARYAAETTGQASAPAILPATAISKSPSMTERAGTGIPGAAPSTVAAIPSPSGTTVPTQFSAAEPSTPTTGTAHVTAPAAQQRPNISLVDQILTALHDAKVESDKIRKYVPRFLDNLRDDHQKELRDDAGAEPKQTAVAPVLTVSAGFFSYQSTRQTSITLSIHT